MIQKYVKKNAEYMTSQKGKGPAHQKSHKTIKRVESARGHFQRNPKKPTAPKKTLRGKIT